jgi:hypothetical protein
MNPAKAVMLAVTSGSQSSSQYWSFTNIAATSRSALNSNSKADIAGLEGII